MSSRMSAMVCGPGNGAGRRCAGRYGATIADAAETRRPVPSPAGEKTKPHASAAGMPRQRSGAVALAPQGKAWDEQP